MAQQLASLNLVAPAFMGINSEDSPLAQDPSYAEVADNAVIDRQGRIAAREGYTLTTTNSNDLNNVGIKTIGQHIASDGTRTTISAADNKIWSGESILVDITPAAYTITADNWKMANFNGDLYLYQRGHSPLVYDGSTLVRVDSLTGAAGIKEANEVLSAWGRLWVADIDGDNSTIYWSDLLIGKDFTGGSSGSINLNLVWPNGADEVVAIAAHNNFLLIFGRDSIVAYQGADVPATMSLADTISGMGCTGRDTVQSTGADVLFLSRTGLRSFGRTIQEKSLPIGDLSATVSKNIIDIIVAETGDIKSVYSQEDNFYLVTFPTSDTIYCFDTRMMIEQGAYRATIWTGADFTCFFRKRGGTLLVGTQNGIGEYGGYQDNGESYRFRYYSPSLTFGDSSRLKFLKKISPTVVAPETTSMELKWYYDFSQDISLNTLPFTVGSTNTGFYGEVEYTVAEFSSGASLISRRTANASGAGTSVTIGVEADINGSPLSIQEINVQALMGRFI